MPLLRAKHAAGAVGDMDFSPNEVGAALRLVCCRRDSLIPHSPHRLRSSNRFGRFNYSLSPILLPTSMVLDGGSRHRPVNIALDCARRQRLRGKHGQRAIYPAVFRTDWAIHDLMRIIDADPRGDDSFAIPN